MNIDKAIMIPAAGAGVGVAYTILSKQYLDSYGNVPWIGDMLPAPWGKWSTLGGILIGGVTFGVSMFTNVVKNQGYQLYSFLTVFGFTTLIGGILNGLFPGGTTARAGMRLAPRARTFARSAVARTASMAPITTTGIPAAQVLS